MNRLPLILAIVLLLLPVLYVGSYMAVVIPGGQMRESCWAPPLYYRIGDERSETFFWPLEQIDRMARPGAWEGAHQNPQRVRELEEHRKWVDSILDERLRENPRP